MYIASTAQEALQCCGDQKGLLPTQYFYHYTGREALLLFVRVRYTLKK